MTDRHSGFLVVLHHDMREDDAEHIRHAIQMINGVQGVTPVPADHTSEFLHQFRIRTELAQRLHELANNLIREV